jgi:hypothetical protein
MTSPGAGTSGPRINFGYVTRLAATASLGGFLFGFDSAVINGAVSGIQKSFHSSSFGTGFQVASLLLGCAAGALIAGRLARAGSGLRRVPVLRRRVDRLRRAKGLRDPRSDARRDVKGTSPRAPRAGEIRPPSERQDEVERRAVVPVRVIDE